MSERFFETEDKRNYETPENNVKMAALKLLRFKTLTELGRDGKLSTWVLRAQDVNEILTVAGLPLIVPEEIHAKEVEVIKVEEEEPDNGDTI